MTAKTTASFFGAALLGLALFYIITGGFSEVLNDRLVADTDYPNEAAAFQMYVTDPWRFPIGINPRFGETNIFFSDGSPIYALLAKGIYSITGLYLSFNYLIIINFLLFALFSFRLGRQLSHDGATQWLIAMLLLFNLVMPSRIIGGQHIALGAYWVLLWAMTCVRTHSEFTRRRNYEPFACAFVAVLSQPYLGAMAVAMVMAQLIWSKRYMAALVSFLIPIVALGAFGVFEGGHIPVHGAKAYSLDLAAYFYSLNWACTGNWYKTAHVAQNDIYLYLGTGVMLLLCVNVIGKILKIFKNKKASTDKHSQIPNHFYALIIAAAFLAIYGMAFDLNLAGHNLASVEIPRFLLPLYERFRVAGRFGTVLCYVSIVLTVLWWCKKRNRNALWWLISIAAIVLQVADAFHASNYATHKHYSVIEDRNVQSNAVAVFFENSRWTGRVVKKVDVADLESQRLLDYLLVRQGATQFSAAHSPRLDPQKAKAQMESAAFSSGDLLITKENPDDPTLCQKTSKIKTYHLCLIR